LFRNKNSKSYNGRGIFKVMTFSKIKRNSLNSFGGCRHRKLITDKKAVALWISWVIMIAFAVSISVLVGKQLIDSSNKSAESLKNYVYDTQECQNAALSIESICQNPEALNIELSNIKAVRVDEFLLKVFDGSGDSETINVQASVLPGDSANITVGKSRIAAKVEIVPVISVGNKKIICTEKTVSESNIQDC
jgi:hypothetical protein